MSETYEYLGVDAKTGRDVYVERERPRSRQQQRSFPIQAYEQQPPESAGRELTVSRREPGLGYETERDYKVGYHGRSGNRGYDNGQRSQEGGWYDSRGYWDRDTRPRSRGRVRANEYDRAVTTGHRQPDLDYHGDDYDEYYGESYAPRQRSTHYDSPRHHYDHHRNNSHHPRHPRLSSRSRAKPPAPRSPSTHNNLKDPSPDRHKTRRHAMRDQQAQINETANNDRDANKRGRCWYSLKPRREAGWIERNFDSSYDGVIAAAAGGAMGAITARGFTGGVRNGILMGQRDAHGEHGSGDKDGKWNREAERGRGSQSRGAQSRGRSSSGSGSSSSNGGGDGGSGTHNRHGRRRSASVEKTKNRTRQGFSRPEPSPGGSELQLDDQEREAGRKEGWSRGLKMAVGGVVGAAAANFAENKVRLYNEQREVKPEERWCEVVRGLG
ncbi:hypothetical protein MBLNU230_g0579t1 [Neophaeotheca triangularis]